MQGRTHHGHVLKRIAGEREVEIQDGAGDERADQGGPLGRPESGGMGRGKPSFEHQKACAECHEEGCRRCREHQARSIRKSSGHGAKQKAEDGAEVPVSRLDLEQDDHRSRENEHQRDRLDRPRARSHDDRARPIEHLVAPADGDQQHGQRGIRGHRDLGRLQSGFVPKVHTVVCAPGCNCDDGKARQCGDRTPHVQGLEQATHPGPAAIKPILQRHRRYRQYQNAGEKRPASSVVAVRSPVDRRARSQRECQATSGLRSTAAEQRRRANRSTDAVRPRGGLLNVCLHATFPKASGG